MTNTKNKKPAWTPPQGGEEFASQVRRGVEGGHDGAPRRQSAVKTASSQSPKRKELAAQQYIEGVLAGDRSTLARTITLIESNAPQHQDKAQTVLKSLLPHTGQSIRVGVTGVPGVGKSSFIELLGSMLTERGSNVAVLAVDPSSSRTGGSILGDKTRMERLSRDPKAFIRPSPSGETLGGVARKSRETILVCEAAGFDVVLIETVGVGQSETTVRSMVDFFLLLMITGAGDELQGIKRGIMELADALVINKADGDNLKRAEAARQEYERALGYLLPATTGWRTRAYTCSALTGYGIRETWDIIENFINQTKESGVFYERRQSQSLKWFNDILAEHLKTRFFAHPAIAQALPKIKASVEKGEMPPTAAVEYLSKLFDI